MSKMVRVTIGVGYSRVSRITKNYSFDLIIELLHKVRGEMGIDDFNDEVSDTFHYSDLYNSGIKECKAGVYNIKGCTVTIER